jgi:D-glycerate 3-kinase
MRARVLIFEGWCLGLEPQSEEALTEPVNALERNEDPDGIWRKAVNTALAGPYRALWATLDSLIFLAAPDFETVRIWRREQQENCAPEWRATPHPVARGAPPDRCRD